MHSCTHHFQTKSNYFPRFAREAIAPDLPDQMEGNNVITLGKRRKYSGSKDNALLALNLGGCVQEIVIDMKNNTCIIIFGSGVQSINSI